MCAKVVSNSATPWTVTHQAPLSMGFPRQEIGVGSHALFQGDLPDPGIKPTSLMSPALTDGVFANSATWEEEICSTKPSLVAQMLTNLPAVQETQIQSLDQEDLQEKGMATYSSILAWESPWTDNLVGYSPWSCKESDMTTLLTLSLFKPKRNV